MWEFKKAQLKRANTLSTNLTIGGEGRVCTMMTSRIKSRVLRE